MSDGSPKKDQPAPAETHGLDTISKGQLWFHILASLLTGTFSAVVTKALYNVDAGYYCGECHKTDPTKCNQTFSKPYMFTLFMFIGEALCLVVYHFNQYRARSAAAQPFRSESQPLLYTSSDSPPDGSSSNMYSGANAPAGTVQLPQVVQKPPLWTYLVFASFDCSATCISGVGLLYITASANQMLRGSAVLFTGLFSVLLLQRRLLRKQWGGILLVVAGLVLVGGAGVWQAQRSKDSDSNDATPLQAAIGVILVLVGSALNSVQNVLEEKILKATGGAEIDPLELVGWEGVFGCILTAFLVLPIAQHIPGSDCGQAENTLDSLKQMGKSQLVTWLMIVYALALMAFNYTSQMVSKHLSAVHRNLISTCRTVLIWVIDIFIYYVFTHALGEAWDIPSWLQLLGFAIILGGTRLYGMKNTPTAEKKPVVQEDPQVEVVQDHHL